MNIRNIIRGFALLAVAAGPFLATQAVADDAEACVKTDGDERIAACTGVINSGRWHGANLAWAFLNRGRAYRDKDDDDHAIADFNQAIKLDPKNNKAYANRGFFYENKGQPDRAIGDYNEAIKLDPKDLNSLINRSSSYNEKQEFDNAIADANIALELCKQDRCTQYGNALAYKERGRAYAGKKDYDRAIADYDESINLGNKWESYRGRANALLLSGKYENAIQAYDGLSEGDPKAGDGLYGRGLTKLKKGDIAGGNADIAAAKALEADIAEQFAKDGIKP